MVVVIPEHLRQITPLSKALAMGLFIILPFAGFWVGIYFQSKVQPREIYVTREKIIKMYPTETPDELITRCGTFPPDSVLKIESNRFSFIIRGPFWSPDCRNIAWSSNNDVYVFNENKQQTRKVFSLSETGNTSGYINLKGWSDSENVIFDTVNSERKESVLNIINDMVVTEGKKTLDIPKDPLHREGFIKRVYQQGSKWYLDVDYIRLYFGESDKANAVKDGVCLSVDNCFWPNGFAIRDLDDILTTIQISTDVKIDLSGLEPYRMSWSESLQDFIPLFKINPSLPEFSQYIDDSSYNVTGPFKIIIKNDVVTNIDGIYLP